MRDDFRWFRESYRFFLSQVCTAPKKTPQHANYSMRVPAPAKQTSNSKHRLLLQVYEDVGLQLQENSAKYVVLDCSAVCDSAVSRGLFVLTN